MSGRGVLARKSSCGSIAFMDLEQKQRRKAGRPSKGRRHGFLIQLSPEKVTLIQLIAEVTDNRPYGDVAETVTADALRAGRDELISAIENFRPYKGAREPLKFQLPMAQAEIIFELAEATGRTYQHILEYLLGEGVKPYDVDEMRRAIAAERAAAEQEMLPVAI